jgi:predicted MFS family arabinose efflux permease
MIIQFFRWIISSDNTSVNTAERNRILKMVEEGKINTEEGTELLDAMGRSSALRGEEKFSRVDMIMLMGAALVVLGFFLPWQYIQRRVYISGLDQDPVGWAILIIGIASVIPIFVTPKNFLYKISMLQIFLNLIGIALVVSILVRVRVGGKLGAGLIFCLAGFIVETASAVVKFKKLAA